MNTVPISAPMRLDMPADNVHHDEVEGLESGVGIRANELDVVRLQRTRHARERAGDDEHHYLEADDWHARAFGQPLAFADGVDGASELRCQDARAESNAEYGEGQREVVVGAVGGQEGIGRRHVEDAVGAACDGRILDDRHAHHLAHEEGDEHEILAGQAQHDRPDHGGHAAASAVPARRPTGQGMPKFMTAITEP